jgi:hypothetical protein
MAKSTRSDIAKFFADTRRCAKSRAKRPEYNCAFDENITIDYLIGLYYAQEGKCALTGQTMELIRGGDWNGGKNPNGCSIDRINPAEGYYIGNVQLSCGKYNVIRGNMTMAQWREMGRMIADNPAR